MLKILKRLSPADWCQAALCLCFITAQVWLDLELPGYMQEITKLVQTPGSDIADVWRAGGYMLLCALGSLGTAFIVGFFAARIAAALSYRLRNDIYDKVESFSMEEIGRFSISSLITRSTNDITQVQMLIAMGLQVMLKAPLLAAWALVKISGNNWQWSVVTGSAVGFLVIVVAVLVVFALPKFKIIQRLTDNLNRVTRENLTGLRVVRAYNAEHYQEAKFETANAELTGTNLFVNRLMALMMPVMTLILNGLSVSIYWIGAVLINAAGLMDRIDLFSVMVVYSAYAIQVVFAFMMLVMIFIMFPRAAVSARRIAEVLDTKPSIVDGTLTQAPWTMGEVEFRNVCFSYPGAAEPVLHNINFKAEAGETVAFIGSTGSGKSTVVSLIPRFYDATSGDILINGKSIRDYRQRDLHNKIGYVPQKAVLFSGTVRDNVVFGDAGRKPPEDGEVQGALEIARAWDFVEKLEDGMRAPVSQGGANLSGGQKQRLAIARAIARQPEILIFDDSFSALDFQTERELRGQLAKQNLGATTFIVAQRIGTIRSADKIVVLDEGKIVGIGRHGELLQSCAVYREIASSQLSEEEMSVG